MPRFRYQTVDANDRPISGELEAARIEDALQVLQASGLHPEPHELEEIADDPIEPATGDRPLSTREATQFAGNLAELTQAELPLGPGLRAMADEVPGRRLSALFRRLAAQADAGIPLKTAIDEIAHQLPGHIRGLILAGTRSGRLAEILGEYAALEQERSDLSWRIRISLAYPLILVVALAVLFIFSGIFIVPPMEAVFTDFGTDMPGITVFFIHTSKNLTPVLIVFLTVLAAFLLPWLVIPRPRWITRCLYSAPFLGTVWKWQALVEFSRLMSLLIAEDVPMADALRLTSDGIQSPGLRAACLKSAARIEAGDTFSDCVDRQRAFPATLGPFVEFGNQSSRPAQGFAAAAEAFQRRIRVVARLWENIIPPVMLVLVGGFVGTMIIAMFMPLVGITMTLS
jgi:type II secretory pathway component PulF